MLKTQTCDSKVKYKNEISAEFVIQERGRELSQDYYKCKICGFIHITTKNKSVKDIRNLKDKDVLSEINVKIRKKGRPRRKGKR